MLHLLKYLEHLHVPSDMELKPSFTSKLKKRDMAFCHGIKTQLINDVLMSVMAYDALTRFYPLRSSVFTVSFASLTSIFLLDKNCQFGCFHWTETITNNLTVFNSF